MLATIIFCAILLVSDRYTSRVADIVAEWCVLVAERWGEPLAWCLLVFAVLAYTTPSALAACFLLSSLCSQ